VFVSTVLGISLCQAHAPTRALCPSAKGISRRTSGHVLQPRILAPKFPGNHRREQRKHSIPYPLAERTQFLELPAVVLGCLFDDAFGS